MLDLEPIFQFSRNNCVAICAFLVPANLLTTIQTLIFSVRQRSLNQIYLTSSIATIFAITLFLHIATWFTIGVITPVTFILGGLGITCLITNLVAIIYRLKFSNKLITLPNAK